MGRKTPFYPNLGSGFVCPAGTEKENGTCVRKPTTSKPDYVRPDVPTKATGSSQSAAAHLQLATQRKTYTPPSVPRGNHQEAKVNPRDNFNKEIGRNLALRRATSKTSGLPGGLIQEIWKTYTNRV